ncbi:MAG: DUF4390 domain-containing protein [Candidatus Marinimicrobia bacterium]|nr:DUF4390 domain-containing protein [Candidatus Neomarinimicrobiota bacterium]
MELFFSEITKQLITGIISFSSIFISSITGVNPEFNSPQIIIEGNSIFISTQLINYSTEELDYIFSSGIPVKIIFSLEIYPYKTYLKPIVKKQFIREIKFDNLQHKFEVNLLDEHKKNEFNSITPAKYMLTHLSDLQIDIPMIPQNNKPFTLILSATPQYIVLSELGEKIDLLLYWNLTRPKLSIELSRELFIE